MSEDIVRRLGVAAILGGSDGRAIVVWRHDPDSRHWTTDISFPDSGPNDGTGLSAVRATDYRVLLGFQAARYAIRPGPGAMTAGRRPASHAVHPLHGDPQ